MTYSAANPAWARLQKARADSERATVVLLAKGLYWDNPDLTWGQCIAAAERLEAERKDADWLVTRKLDTSSETAAYLARQPKPRLY